MRGYSLDWEAVMRLPMRAFWTLLKNLNRLRAADDIRTMNLLWMQGATDPEARREFIEDLKSRIGVTTVERAVRDLEGLRKLKSLSG